MAGDQGADPRRKAALRASAASARRSLSPDERRAASAAVVRRLEELPELRAARTVLLYAAGPTETDVGALVDALRPRGVRTLFPRVRGEELELVAAADLLALQLGYRGIREPVGPRVDPAVVDVAVVPGVAFDPNGGRLGQGGGHYDRLLLRLPERCPRVGACFAVQMVPSVPREPHDRPVDVVVTDRGVHRRTQAG